MRKKTKDDMEGAHEFTKVGETGGFGSAKPEYPKGSQPRATAAEREKERDCKTDQKDDIGNVKADLPGVDTA